MLLQIGGPAPLFSVGRCGGTAPPHEQPLVAPQEMHFRQVPLRTMVNWPHSVQGSPSYPLMRAWRIISRSRAASAGAIEAWPVAAVAGTITCGAGVLATTPNRASPSVPAALAAACCGKA